ncbi:Uncharacterized protein BP5553_09884 [Venustampulla echinocandica]|uniref:Uncharacterized protein n=1 Tax=Venustampulla echinocandica TaxID=2656787 RepID=A0A370TAY5_9HELO|nr:Uncharacterized protein BP5553_09884 [Venustampulla echinocandica]RDL31095.1 Uncharacterized protein BP5553_09884 [Venustampulla echinocandica]
MASSLPKSSIGALARLRCPNGHVQLRSFSTTASVCLIGPESPKFIEIPASVQPQVRSKPVIKGVLPRPRDLFPKRAGNKTSAEYFGATIPTPTAQSEPANDYVAWKREMAEMRRKNLREGLVALRARKTRQDQRVAHRSLTKSREREARLHAPQREDERLTSPTITEAMRTLQVGPVPDPYRKVRVAKKAARVAANEAAREDARKNALHTLYMNARSFITTEEQLDAKIEEIFVKFPFQGSSSNNIWDAKGPPPTVRNMLSTINHSQKRVIDYHSGPAVITGERIKKIAEELTGGKMD